MALELFMVGLSPKDMGNSVEFYRRLGLAIPEETEGMAHVPVKMTGELTFFLNTTKIVDVSDRPRLILEFFLKERPAVDAKYAEMIAFGYEPYHVPYVVASGMYFAMINDPDDNIVLLSAE